MNLSEFKTWVDGLRSSGLGSQAILDRIRQKLDDECPPALPAPASGLLKQHHDRSDRDPSSKDGPYIEGPWGPEQPL